MTWPNVSLPWHQKGLVLSIMTKCLPSCLLAFLPSCLPAFLPSCLLAFLPSCLLAFLPSCLLGPFVFDQRIFKSHIRYLEDMCTIGASVLKGPSTFIMFSPLYPHPTISMCIYLHTNCLHSDLAFCSWCRKGLVLCMKGRHYRLAFFDH